MSLALIIMAGLAQPAAAAMVRAQPSEYSVDRSVSETDRLRELEIAVRKALAKREIDAATARELHIGIARTRRRLVLMGMQVGYRQRVQLRLRIDRLYARLEQSRMARAADIRSGN